jgi:hypothetical protein
MEMVALNAPGETPLPPVVDTFCSLLAHLQVFARLL